MYSNLEKNDLGQQYQDAVTYVTGISGAADGIATLDSDGKLTSSQLPDFSIAETFTAASEAIQLALPTAPDTREVTVGDICVRTDEEKTYICIKDYDGSQSSGNFDAYWTLLQTPTDLVQSVAGKTGVVTLVVADMTDLTATATELNYNSGVTSDIQTQINDKIASLLADSSPQLGGNLDINGFDIVSTSNGDIDLLPNGTGVVKVLSESIKIGSVSNIDDKQIIANTGETNLPRIRYKVSEDKWQFSNDGSVFIDMASTSSGLAEVEDDLTPTLGGNLELNGNSVGDLTADEITILHNTVGNGSIIGVKWDHKVDFSNSSPTLQYVSYPDLNEITVPSIYWDTNTIYSQFYRCNLDDDGNELARYGEADFAYDGSNGQVMVHMPKYYYKSYEENGAYYLFLSSHPEAGFKLIPEYTKDDSTELSQVYIGALEACAYDVSESAYITDDSAGVDFTPSTGDKLSSIAGVKPISGLNNDLTRDNARILAENRGTGWQLQDFTNISSLQMLFIVRYATLNSQSVFRGVADITDDSSTNMAVNTGFTCGVGTGANDLGNESGEVSISHYQTAQTTKPFSFCGIENFYSNIWKWTDGFNIDSNKPLIAKTASNYADNTSTNYNTIVDPLTGSDISMPSLNNYWQEQILTDEFDWGFIPLEIQTSSPSDSKYFCDYYYQSTGWRVALFGGYWNGGSALGAFYWALAYSSASFGRAVGSRIKYTK
jgi:hypothetical protein